MTMVRERTASGGKHSRTEQSKINVGKKSQQVRKVYQHKTHIFIRPMWKHRRLVVVHAFIGKVVIDNVNELYKFLSSTKHAFRHLKREKGTLIKMCM